MVAGTGAVGALLRYFRDLDTAEEAFQEACLRALKAWPRNGPPRDPAALATALATLLGARDQAIPAGRAGRRRVVDHFSVARMVDHTLGFYEQVFGDADRARDFAARAGSVDTSSPDVLPLVRAGGAR